MMDFLFHKLNYNSTYFPNGARVTIIRPEMKDSIPEILDILEEVESDGSDGVNFYFRRELTPEEITALEAMISAHPTLAKVKKRKLEEISSKTQNLIAGGFEWKGATISLSTDAQKNWIGMVIGKDLLTYPVTLTDKFDTVTVTIDDEAELLSFYGLGMSAVKGYYDAESQLKASVFASSTVGEVDAVVDNR